MLFRSARPLVAPAVIARVRAALDHHPGAIPALALVKDSGISWNDDNLSKYLENPQQVIKGTRMAFPGLKKPEDRADVIAYLKSLK